MSKKMKVTITDKSVNFGTGVTPLDFLSLAFSACLMVMRKTVENTPVDYKQEVKEDLYDKFNQMASRTLETFIPDKELRPDLTEQAILEKEDEIMQRYIDDYEKQTRSK